MSFLSAMKTELLENFNDSITENGAIGYRTTGKSLLDINFAVASLRSASDAEIIRYFKAAYLEDKMLAMKWLFFARDVRGGLGERRLFRTAMRFVAEFDPDVVAKTISLIPEYGRFDDWFEFLDDDQLRTITLFAIKRQYESDLKDYAEGMPISLLAKWLPSCNASSEKTRHYAKIIRKNLGLSESVYRKVLSKLRKYLDVVEVKMSSKRWGDIEYEKVPSRANILYGNAFLRNDGVRRKEYLSKLESGEAKINASTLFPHDIVHKYYNSGYYTSLKKHDITIEALWRALPDMVDGCGNTIVVADGSGSMLCNVGNTTTTALDVANALAIYFAERSAGEFKDKYITFSSRPQLVDFSDAASLRDKLAIAASYHEVANTNVEAVFDLILSTAVNSGMSQEDIPANILIISDMEFDHCAVSSFGSVNAKLFKMIENKYIAAGYRLPRLIFWNVNSRTKAIPVIENDLGVALVSGFSVNICKLVMSGETDPYQNLINILNSERYLPVEEVLS